MSDAMRAADAEAAAVASAPRVTFDDIQNEIAEMYFVTGDDIAIISNAGKIAPPRAEIMRAAGLLTICLAVTKDGFTLIGKSAPASPENFDADLGRKLAADDVARQLWPLMGFRLKSELAASNPNISV
jgi:hypothetical protein